LEYCTTTGALRVHPEFIFDAGMRLLFFVKHFIDGFYSAKDLDLEAYFG
jgi:hypothetical protein